MACIHISIAGWWIGSLVAMERACALGDVGQVSSLVQRFSNVAVVAIVLLVVAGIVMILALISWPVAVTSYIVTLAVKIGLATGVFALASYNKFRLTPRLMAADAAAMQALRKSIDVELVLIGAVLVTTAILTTYNAPEE
jgi:putative copper export protein